MSDSTKEKEIRARKYLFTIQSSQIEAGWGHQKIKNTIKEKLKGVTYFAMCDEIADTGSLHTHLVLYSPNTIRLSTIKRAFTDNIHVEVVRSSVREVREYLKKTGKHEAKAHTSIEGSFEEEGTLPLEPGQGSRSDLQELYEQIVAGVTNAELMRLDPENIMRLNHIDKARLEILSEKYRNTRRTGLQVIYTFGSTGCGKTRFVLDTHGSSKVYRVTDYKHPFDMYSGEEVLVFEEFRSDLPIGSMLNYLDIYPIQLPARYNNKQASFNVLYILTNIKLECQYQNIQTEQPETWVAFLRRIHIVRYYYDVGKFKEFNGTDEYFQAVRSGLLSHWQQNVPVEETPFFEPVPVPDPQNGKEV